MLRKGRRMLVAVMLTWCGVINVTEAQQERKQEANKSDKGKVSVDVDAESDRDTKARRRDEASKGMAYRASEIQGMSVDNRAGKNLGTVEDIVIDVRAGEVRYAALSYGGFLGLGDTLFAVPWDVFEHHHETAKDDHTLVLSLDEATLKNAPGFDQSRWPNFADGNVTEELGKHYGKSRRQRKGQADIDINAGPVEVDVDVHRKRDRIEGREATSKDTVLRASRIIGLAVKDADEKELGKVNDLVIDMDTGKVRYAALSYGGFVGLGDKLFAVPWNLFKCEYDPSDENHQFVLAIDEATLRNTPGFDQDKWPNLANPKFAKMIDKSNGDQSRGTTDRTIR